MAKLIFNGDELMAAALDSPQECEAVREALRYVMDHADIGDRGALVRSGSDMTRGEWIDQVRITLGHLDTPSPR